MRKLLKKKRGQMLVVAVTAIFALFVFGLAIIEIGNLVYEKVHVQNIADAGAMEAGTWYARGLNMASLSNKILVAMTGIAIGATMGSFGTTWPFWEKILNGYMDFQDFFAGTGDAKALPWLVELTVLINGQRNGAASMAFFNVETFRDYQWPSFNLKRRSLNEVLDPEQLTAKYYYVESETNKRVDVDKNEVKTNSAGRIYQDGTGKFVIKQQGIVEDGLPEEISGVLGKVKEAAEEIEILKEALEKLRFDVIETGPHTVLVGSLKKDIKQKLGTDFFKGDDGKHIQPTLAACALARIDGGSMYFWELDGASYSPHLDRVIVPDLSFLMGENAQEFMKQIGQFTGNTEGEGEETVGPVGFLNRIKKALTGGVLLH